MQVYVVDRPVPFFCPALKILVFLQGTVLIESSILGETREDSVKRSREWAVKRGPLGDLIPIGHSATKLASWKTHGAEICYLTASKKIENVKRSEQALRRWRFPDGVLFSRSNDESYADIAVREKPHVIVEDDCESIGGAKEMVHPNLPENIRQSSASVVAREFEGIDALPDDPESFLPR